MTAALEIRDRAQLFGWETHVDENRKEDTFIHGEHMITVRYRRDWTVDCGQRYVFYKITDPQLQEFTPVRSKKSAVVAWLARLGS